MTGPKTGGRSSAPTHRMFGPSLETCAGVDSLLRVARGWRNDSIPYECAGPNSNSVASCLSRAGGFIPPTVPPKADGWGVAIPGVSCDP